MRISSQALRASLDGRKKVIEEKKTSENNGAIHTNSNGRTRYFTLFLMRARTYFD